MTDPRRVLTRPVPSAYTGLAARMRFHVEPEISCSRFFGEACLERPRDPASPLTELGAFVRERLRGGLFIDVPCGLFSARDPGRDVAIPPIAVALGAGAMWEIDATWEVVADRVPQRGGVGMRTEAGLPIATMHGDILRSIAAFPDASAAPKAIYVSALQPHADLCADAKARADTVLPYLRALLDEIARACAPGDLAILNSSAMLVEGLPEDDTAMLHPALALPPRGFALMRRCRYDKVHVFVKE